MIDCLKPSGGITLPTRASIHPIFHVSPLKLKVRTNAITTSNLLITDEGGKVKVMPVAILDKKLMKKKVAKLW
jgi:hypothetical protein